MMNIRHYIEKQKKLYPNGVMPIDTNWNRIFEKGGYYRVDFFYTNNSWPEAHKWCKNVIGKKHYSWTGHTFWFETSQHALMFKLCWG